MKTWFYNQTAYELLGIPLPQCFIELDEYFDTRFKTARECVLHQSRTLAENLCRRMADVELYACFIGDAQKNSDLIKASILIGTLLVGYFSSCKSLLDAGAITLTKVYNLPLRNKEMDFISKPKFWRELNGVSTTVHSRYMSFKDFFDEITKWRDSAIHRITPFVTTYSQTSDKGLTPTEIKIASKPEYGIAEILEPTPMLPLVEPSHFHRKWQSRMIEFCGEICSDIRERT